MDMEIRDEGNNVRKVLLSGRLDTPAVLQIEPQFVTGLVPGGKHAIVDLSKVDFVASMGIRMFISVARIMRDKQAKLAFYAPQQMVGEVLKIASLHEIVPVCATADDAVKAVQS